MGSHKTLTFIQLFSIVTLSFGQCPSTVSYPCTCSSTRYESVSIACDHAASLDIVIQAVGRPTVPIDSLIITNTVIPRLPAYAFQAYSVKRLVLRNNSMMDIDPLAFESPLITQLTELELRSNSFVEIPQNGISRLQKLQILILAKNNIQNLRARTFRNFECRTVLTKLDLSSNQISNADPDSLIDLTVIQDLNFDKNQFQSIPTESLRRLATLEDLSLGINQLEIIPNNALPLTNLKSLSLEVNKIRRLQAETFQMLPNLLYLYLSANQFESIDGEIFKFVPRLKVLAMGGNPKITTVSSSAFRFVPELVRLELSDCRIQTVESGAFQTIPKVQVIVLTKNRLQSVTRNMFHDLYDLYSLDLKGNLISSIDNGAFARLSSLRHLDMSTNNVSAVDSTVFTGTFERTVPSTTRVLYLYENPWLCDEKLDWFRRWLRDNMDILIDAPGYAPAVCKSPNWLSGWPLRLLDPLSSVFFTTTQDISLPLIDGGEGGRLSGASLTALILGVILGIFFVTLALLMVMRYFVSKRRRDTKLEDEEGRRFGSTISGYQSAHGSAYPSPPLENPNEQRQGYFLNRPWYWWF